MKNWKRALAALVLAALMLTLIGCTDGSSDDGLGESIGDALSSIVDTTDYDFTVSYDGIRKDSVSSGVSVHDPSVVKVGDTYYIFGSHMSAAKSTDLMSWKKVADGYAANNPVYGQIYSVSDKAFAWAGSKQSTIPTDDGGVHVWAPDVIYNEHTGLYYMYYCTTSTWSASNLCYGTSAKPEGPYEWQGALIYSGFTMDNIGKTNVLDVVSKEYAQENYMRGAKYNHRECPNAIDPSIFFDEDGRMWMTYGSWSGGIFLLELDPTTGGVIFPEADEENGVDPYFGKLLIGGGHKSIEAPYIEYDPASGYYYLFVSYGALNRTGGYQIRVYRSETPDGEYLDMKGQRALAGYDHSYYGLKLSGNYMLPSLYKAYMATGHNSALVDDDGKLYVVFHTRFDGGSEIHSPRAHQLVLNAEGWPCMLPYQTQGETVSASGYDKAEVVGRYFVINQGMEISDAIAQPVILYLKSNGKVVGEDVEGEWSMQDGSYFMSITIGEDSFSGVFCQMKDEGETPVMAFSAVGDNESVWGVKYVEAAE